MLSRDCFKVDGLLVESDFDPVAGVLVSATTLIYRVHTIELPINFLYDLPLRKDGKLFFTASLYFGGNIAGLRTLNPDNNSKDERSLKFGNEPKDDDYTMDIGFNAGVGYQFPFRMYTRLQYGWGVPDFLNSGAMRKNRIFSVGVGYSF